MIKPAISFAQRTAHLKPEGAYQVLGKANELEAAGRDIIHFEIGQPDFDTFPNISMVGIRAITEGRTRYTPPAGMPSLQQVIADSRSCVPVRRIAVRFHNALAEAIIAVAKKAGLNRVVLSGGCFQNRRLAERTIRQLRKEHFSPYWLRYSAERRRNCAQPGISSELDLLSAGPLLRKNQAKMARSVSGAEKFTVIPLCAKHSRLH